MVAADAETRPHDPSSRRRDGQSHDPTHLGQHPAPPARAAPPAPPFSSPQSLTSSTLVALSHVLRWVAFVTPNAGAPEARGRAIWTPQASRERRRRR